MGRLLRIDALRGLAVFGILLINVWGFVYGYTVLRYGALPEAASVGDQLAIFVCAAFAEQKFYPVFSFLFGAGFALQWKSLLATHTAQDAAAIYRRRIQWLLACGLLHGCLLWLGDILTAYSLIGFWLLAVGPQRLGELWRTARTLVWINAGLFALIGGIAFLFASAPLAERIETVIDLERSHAIYTLGGMRPIAWQRVTDFGAQVIGFPFFLPRLALLFLCGVFAVRLGWLTRPERHRRFWWRVLAWSMALALPLNLWWGTAALTIAADPFHQPLWTAWASAVQEMAGAGLAAGYVAAFMLAAPRALAWLAPVGRMALTNYLMQSLLCALLLQGQGLGWGAHLPRAALPLFCAGVMLFQLAFSHYWLARHAQGPMEALWRRYTLGA